MNSSREVVLPRFDGLPHPLNLSAGDQRVAPVWEIDMTTERQVQEMAARCVSSMGFYINSNKTKQAKDAMGAEARLAARLAAQQGLTDQATVDSLLRLVDAGMVARYGVIEGHKVFGEFAKVFNGLAATVSFLPKVSDPA